MKTLIQNVHVITGDQKQMYQGVQNILVEDDCIKYMGKDQLPADKVINGKNKIAMPGLINGHTHSPMVLMRNAADDLPLERWLKECIFPMEEKLTQKHIYNGTMLALVEMIKSGTTAFMDMYFDVPITAQAVEEAHIKANLSYGLLTCHQLDNGIDKAIETCKAFYKQHHKSCADRLHTSLEIHSVYLYDQALLEQAVALAKETDQLIHIHLHETKTEVENSIKQYGMTPIQLCEKLGVFDQKTTAAHTVWVEDDDLRILKDGKVIPVHNPSSNLKLASGFARIPAMQDLNIDVALGTDGAASNNDLDMFCEMHLASLIHKGMQLDATAVNASQVIEMATQNGAKALGFDNTGQLKEGYKADILLIDTDQPHLTPLHDPVAALVYSTKGSDVHTVMIDGKIILENKELLYLDEEKIRYQAQASANELLGKN